MAYSFQIYLLDHPCLHPAAPHRPTPHVLKPYDVTIYPQCLGRTFQHLLHLDTLVGKVLKCLLSPGGVTALNLVYLLHNNIGCSVCRCMFSISGFHDHAPANICGNFEGGKFGMSISFSRNSLVD